MKWQIEKEVEIKKVNINKGKDYFFICNITG
jgi:hypothetical protein